MKNTITYIAALINVFSVMPYIIDVVRKKTKPNIVSWVTWTVLTSIGTAAVITEAGLKSALLPLSSTLCTAAIVLLGFKYGFAKYSKFDIFCQVMAAIGLALWLIFNSPSIALIAVIAIDFMACLPTIVHAWSQPQQETWQTFAIGSFAAFLSLAAIESFTFAKLAYPLYLGLANGTIATSVIYRRLEKGIKLSRKSIHETLHENL